MLHDDAPLTKEQACAIADALRNKRRARLSASWQLCGATNAKAAELTDTSSPRGMGFVERLRTWLLSVRVLHYKDCSEDVLSHDALRAQREANARGGPARLNYIVSGAINATDASAASIDLLIKSGAAMQFSSDGMGGRFIGAQQRVTGAVDADSPDLAWVGTRAWPAVMLQPLQCDDAFEHDAPIHLRIYEPPSTELQQQVPEPDLRIYEFPEQHTKPTAQRTD